MSFLSRNIQCQITVLQPHEASNTREQIQYKHSECKITVRKPQHFFTLHDITKALMYLLSRAILKANTKTCNKTRKHRQSYKLRNILTPIKSNFSQCM